MSWKQRRRSIRHKWLFVRIEHRFMNRAQSKSLKCLMIFLKSSTSFTPRPNLKFQQRNQKRKNSFVVTSLSNKSWPFKASLKLRFCLISHETLHVPSLRQEVIRSKSSSMSSRSRHKLWLNQSLVRITPIRKWPCWSWMLSVIFWTSCWIETMTLLCKGWLLYGRTSSLLLMLMKRSMKKISRTHLGSSTRQQA